MLLLKPTYKVDNTLRFLISLPARVVRLNNYARMGLLFILFAGLANKGLAQTGTCSDPIIIDLTGHPDTSFRRSGDIRQAQQCCGAGGPSTTCVSYRIIIDPSTDVLSVSLPPNGKKSNSEKYYVNCDGPYDLGTPVCISDHTIPYVISYCKPGADLSVDLVFNLTRGFSVSPDVYLRQGCTGTMSVSHLIPGTIKWTSGNPTYDSYLSSTTDSTVTVNPPAVPPASGYIDYTVTGTEQSPCDHTIKTGVVRAWIYPALNVSISSTGASVCSGNPVTLTAAVSGGNPGYTYLWSTNETTPSITVSTPGTYTVSVNDQLSNCGPTTKSITIGASTPVAPTAPSVSICRGSATVLTATAPGGPYQWYDPSGNPVGDGVSASYTTPAFMASGTYNYSVMTSFGGCPSQKATVAVTVLPTSAAPTASPVTVCTGNKAVLTATAPGAPYQWYDPSGNLVGTGASYTAPLLPAGTYNYTVISSVTGCPGQSTTVPVTVLPTPPGPTASSVTVCSGNAATLTATAPGGPYQWYNAAGTLVSSNASYTTPVFATAGTYNYTVMTSFGGCPSQSTPVTVTVLPTPPPPTAPPATICTGTTATLTATAPGGPYQWYDPSGNPVGDGISASYTTPILTTGATNSTYNYTVKTSFGGCPSTSTTVPVTVTPLPPTPTVQSQ